MKYPFVLTPDAPGFTVTFPDLPEAITYGETKEEAIDLAYDCLVTALDFYFDDMRAVPEPSKVKDEQYAVMLPASVTVKVKLLNEMTKQRIKQADLARLMNLSPTQVNRMVNLHRATKVDTLDRAFKALGKTLEFEVI
ncbi:MULTISPECIES: type II toxin-antitoxin system HicB family antitoxin [Oligella]|uniref:Antitoxin n=1 Tax=Oligella urethralis DNF00040 TaxID=1401065 RepID=A0A096BFZ1_9BURK|nr:MULTISPECIES: type II toxin-antitoxin system HicB family antitoxin [Oligella]KGF32079.1 antitoxin [Oligella urethralis DNF00040]OFS83779.1 antitoxin [Oligella sp. HMSC05A10]OFV49311.1 antitoxin [Oligella sp. HMSC09E12]PMC18244.1 type II toxin-antitoxin system HicB family antitoxin [Oligella urethralis]SUA62327.1 Antitoxin HicB [Oligella urethralis]